MDSLYRRVVCWLLGHRLAHYLEGYVWWRVYEVTYCRRCGAYL